MSNVKNRILQFQQNQSPSEAVSASIDAHQKPKPPLNRNTSATTITNSAMNNNNNTYGRHEETPPPKPPLNLKARKTSLTINLSTNNGSNGHDLAKNVSNKPGINGSTKLVANSSGSAIPKLVTPPAPHGAFTNSNNGNGKLYGSFDWKEKYEESEKKRTHVVTLAQKATRDYEELRRRYHDVYTENEKLVHKLDNSNVQLDKLRKASEATYDEYYKLKKKYQVENSAKSDALVRVDQYNKENRRLKRQSQVLMQQMNDPNFALDDIVETSAENPESDKEIIFLRNKVQEMEARIVDLESELEKTKLAEFETQESVLLMNDSVQMSKSETSKLIKKIKELEDEKADLKSTVEELTFELDSIKTEESFQTEKLQAAENALLKVTTEKKVLQRQSMVFMSGATDSQLLDSLNQISELQFTLEEQKLNYEGQILELQDRLNEQYSKSEINKIEVDAKVRALEAQVELMRTSADEAERSFTCEDNIIPGLICAPAPPPPPMPPSFGAAPPPPPMPSGGFGASSLGASLKSATLRKAPAGNTGNNESNSGTTSPSNGSQNNSPQIDDVISQLKKGIKLRPMDRTLTRKQTEPLEKQGEETAVEEMRSILNNLKRTRRT